MGNSKFLKVGLFNAGSLGTKHEDFIAAMQNYSVDLMAINETWLRPGETGRAPIVPNYRLRHVSRPSDVCRGRGGGVGFYIRKGVSVRLCPHPAAPNVEQMWFKLNIKSTSVIIGTAYRPQWLYADDFFEALTESVASFSNCDNMILLGDFNINALDNSDPNAKALQIFLSNTGLKQIVDKPAHFTDHSEKLIDLVCTNVRARNVNVELVGSHIGHAYITCVFAFHKPKIPPKCIMYRPLQDICLDVFTTHLESIRWDLISSSDHVDDLVSGFNQAVWFLFDLHSPIKTKIIRDPPSPWITDTIKVMMRLRDAALARFRISKRDSHKTYYKDLKRQVNLALHSEKQAYFNQHINHNIKNSKTLWKNLKKSVLPPSSTDMPSQFDNPDAINDNFLNIPVNVDVSISSMTYFEFHKFNDSSFVFETVSSNTVLKYYKQIKTNALGIDGISRDMINLTLPHTLDTITALTNKSLASGMFPTLWKTAIVKPIPKLSDPQEYKDLRPISLLPTLSKILEKVVCCQITRYLEKEHILLDMQSGFRKLRGTSTALLDVTDNILASQDKGMGTILVLLDFSRAFDSINISLLLSKLNFYGFDSTVIRWFNSYLSSRAQLVEIKKDSGEVLRSSLREITRGVPQGSILGPLLFILFSADVVNCIQHCKFHVYADDIQLYLSFKPGDIIGAENKLNQDLERVQAWALQNSLLLNAKKTKFMILGTKHQIQSIAMSAPLLKIGGEMIERVYEARNLGLILDEQLKFEHHINEIVRNSFYRLKVLYKIRNYITTPLRVTLVDSLVLSRFNYVDVVYGPCIFRKTSRLIQRVQNACARFCFNVPPRSRITPFLNEHKVLKMELRRELHLATLMFGLIKYQQPHYLYSKLCWVSDHNPYPLRTTSKVLLRTPRHGSAAFRGSFSFNATKCWNSLPPPLRKLESKFSFRVSYKKHLLEFQRRNIF